MSDLALQAYLCNYLEENKDIRFFCTLKKDFIELADLIYWIF